MNLLTIQLSGAEIGVWAALLFTGGLVFHFWWTQRLSFLADPSLNEKRIQQEADKWKNRFLQEKETTSLELERIRKELETIREKYQSVQSALQSKDELLQHLKIEHRAYRDLLTSSLQSDNHRDKRPDGLLIPAYSQPRPDGNPPVPVKPDSTPADDLHRAELRIEELELKLLDKEEELDRITRKTS